MGIGGRRGRGGRRGCDEGRARHAGTAGDSERGGMADGSARVPEVLAPAELEGFLAGVMGPELLEPALCAPVGADVEEAQELAVDPTRGADDTRQEGVGDTRPRGVGLPVAVHLGARCGLEELVGLGMPESSVATDIGHVIAAKLVNEGDIDDEVGVTADVGALDDQVTLSCLAILFLHGRDVAPVRSMVTAWLNAKVLVVLVELTCFVFIEFQPFIYLK